MVTYCDVIDKCADCPKYGDDCDGDKRNDDLISRADAIEAVRKVVIDNDVVDALKALPSADAVQGWIPCSERLPDWKDMVEGVIITTENGRVTFADYCTEKGMFHDVGQDVWASDIIAWMPLPTPYKGGDDE